MPEVIIDKIDTNIKYDIRDNDAIVESILKLYKQYDENRATQKDQIEIIKKLLSVDDLTKNAENIDSFQDEFEKNKFQNIFLKDSSIRRIHKTFEAHLYGSTFKVFNNAFSIDLSNTADVVLKNKLTAMKKKEIIRDVEYSKPNEAFRKACGNLSSKGEAIVKTTWSQKYCDVRRRATFDFAGFSVPLSKYEYQRVLKYDGIKMECIQPENFIYDEEKNIYIEENWLSVQDILKNQEFAKFLNEAQKREIKDLSGTSQSKYKQKDCIYKDGKYRVLEFTGDFELTGRAKGDNEFYYNLKIIVIGDKWVGFFGYNPNIVNPYSVCRYETDERTGRGVPMLASLISNSLAITDTLNKLRVALGLSIFKHHIVKAGVFVNDKNGIDITPGGKTEVNIRPEEGETLQNIMKELDMGNGLQIGQVMIDFLKGESEESTQTFKLASGDIEKAPKTLGQSKLQMQGQNILYAFNSEKVIDLILEIVEKVGAYQANFKEKPELVKYKDLQGNEQDGVIDSKVRQEEYIYIVDNMSTATDRRLNNQEFIDVILAKVWPIAQRMGYQLNIEKLLNNIGSDYEQENASEFITKIAGVPNGLPQPPGMPGGLPPNPNAQVPANIPQGAR